MQPARHSSCRSSQRLAPALGASLAACLLILTTAVEARSWNRSGSVTGPRGGVTTYSAAGACAAGHCSRSAVVTGPGGRNATRTGAATRTAPGQWQGTRGRPARRAAPPPAPARWPGN